MCPLPEPPHRCPKRRLARPNQVLGDRRLPPAVVGRRLCGRHFTQSVSEPHVSEVWDRLADVRLPVGDLGALHQKGLHVWILHQGVLNLAEPRPVLG